MRDATVRPILGIVFLLLGTFLGVHGLVLDAPGELFRGDAAIPMALSTFLVALAAALVAAVSGFSRRDSLLLVVLAALAGGVRAAEPASAGGPAALTLLVIPAAAIAGLGLGKREDRTLALLRLTGAAGVIYSVWSLYCWWDIQLSPELARRAVSEAAFGRDILASSVFSDRNVLPLGHANFNGGVAVLVAPLVAWLAWRDRRERWRLAWFAGVPAALLLLWSSGSRAGLIGLAVAAIGAVFVLLIRKGVPRRRLALAGAGALTLVVAFAALHPRSRETLKNPAGLLSSDAERLELARTGVKLFRDNPVFGHGAGSLPAIYPGRWSGDGELTNSWQLHITPLQLAVEGGLPLLLAWLALPVSAVFALRRDRTFGPRSAAALAISGYWACGWFDHQLNVPFIAGLTGLTAGLTLATENGDDESRPAPWIPVGLALLAAIPAVLIGADFQNRRNEAFVRADMDGKITPGDAVSPLVRASKELATGSPEIALICVRNSLRVNPQSGVAWRLLADVEARLGHRDAAVEALAIHALLTPDFQFSPEWKTPALAGVRNEFKARLGEVHTTLKKDFAADLPLLATLDYRARLDAVYERHGERFTAFLHWEGPNDRDARPTAPALLAEAARDNDSRKLRALGYFARRLYDDSEAAALLAHLRGETTLPPEVRAYGFPSYGLMLGRLEATPPDAGVIALHDASFDLLWPDLKPAPGRIPGAFLRARAEKIISH